VTISFPA